MKSVITLIIITILLSCNHRKTSHDLLIDEVDADFTIAFGSCNNQRLPNDLWNEILKNNPDVWIWGGDNIYADTDDMKIMQSYYNEVKNNDGYKNFISNVDVQGTWDDHDFGINDGGTEFIKKDSAQQLFLDFFDVPLNDSRRNRKGVYYSKTFKIGDKSIKMIILDTRYFRTALTTDPSGNKRYVPAVINEGTILGSSQWAWLEKELNNSNDDFTIIMSSIQFLSYEHGFETWGNMPHEVEKLKSLIVNSKAKRILLLSGDRHISEISAVDLEGLDYPLYDFTSSGLTHSYTSYTFEPNEYRKSKVVTVKNFGLLKFDLQSNTVSMELRGLENNLLESMVQKY
ncbi:MAG: alkaline phosphatase D family protein [Aureibaculum sp.]|nr:alkaline phosphatase D family protein [Aureibaculum sp.]